MSTSAATADAKTARSNEVFFQSILSKHTYASLPFQVRVLQAALLYALMVGSHASARPDGCLLLPLLLLLLRRATQALSQYKSC